MGSSDDVKVEQLLTEAQDSAAASVATAGDWLTGAERVAVWAEVRDAATNPLDSARREAVTPYAVAGEHGPAGPLSAVAVEVVHRVASDPGRLTRSWAEQAMAELGEEVYVELVGVVGITTVLDRFSLAMGDELRPLPEPVEGSPARVRPDGMGDVGAWVSQRVEKIRANVGRAISLVPVTEAVWGQLVNAHYSRGPQFGELVWDRDLSRPQVELTAARTTAHNECFY